MSKYYWELVQKDGTVIYIPPEAVEVVKRRWNEGQPIHTSQGSVPSSQIKHFRPTDKPHGEQPLLEAAAQAFNEPVINPDGSIDSRWIKRRVPHQLFNRQYANIPAYRKIGEEAGLVVMAYRLPVHLINVQETQPCTEEEIRILE